MHFLFFSSTSFRSSIYSRLIHSLHGLPSQQRDRAIHEAQQALTEYLHSTRCLSFTHAEHISKNCPSSLLNLLSKFKFSISNVSKTLHRFLRYHPVNEFEFFFESIGFSPSEIPAFLPPHKFFLSEDNENLLLVVHKLVEYSFPWDKLGRIYKEEASVFNESPRELMKRLRKLEAFGFDRVLVIGICLAYPSILGRNSKSGGEVEVLLGLLKRFFYDFNFVSCIGDNVDVCYEICRKIMVFYNLGCEKQMTGELIGRSCDVFVRFAEKVFVKKVDFFCRMGMEKEDIGLLILQHPKILSFNLEGPVINICDYLKQIGLDNEKLNVITIECPHVLGKNRVENLPQTMKALDLHD